MEYHWSNSSWQRMEAIRKQEDYQSKLARDMHDYYHGGSNGVNAYDRSNNGHGNFISRGHNGYRNFTPKRHNGVVENSEKDKIEADGTKQGELLPMLSQPTARGRPRGEVPLLGLRGLIVAKLNSSQECSKLKKEEHSRATNWGISVEDPCTWTSMLGRNHTMEFEEQGEIVGKELSLFHEDSLLTPFLNTSLLYGIKDFALSFTIQRVLRKKSFRRGVSKDLQDFQDALKSYEAQQKQTRSSRPS
ncbi:hypothetical protein M9H77_07912 [Catharanthus roseus]|uniref:Uncharacterized protein n=1 Tax=Catharanthus roseus TaxID=4058 RepID=A0ACC0BWJ1_CATRO|nr:hypothetical protein M9H77_07912 [Catharanthus roseus]